LAEYHSIALLEAMRAGKAIVATDVGGNTESVRNLKEGLIVPAADVERLVHAIDRMVIDRSLAKKLGEAARERFKDKFTEEIMVRQTAQWLVRCATL
jgi:glycosyltransferase involved in cell wall biosynthesis